MVITAKRTVVVQSLTLLAVAKEHSHSNQTDEGLEAPLGFLERTFVDVVYCFFHKR